MSTDYWKTARAVEAVSRVLGKAPVSRILLIGLFGLIGASLFAPYPWKLFQSKDLTALEEQLRDANSREKMIRNAINYASDRTSYLERAVEQLEQRLQAATKERDDRNVKVAEQDKKIANQERIIKQVKAEVTTLKQEHKSLQDAHSNLVTILTSPMDETTVRALMADAQKGPMIRKLLDELIKNTTEVPAAPPRERNCFPVLGPC